MFKILRPKDGLKVHNPQTKLFLNKDGQEVKMTTYWRRRLACGDVVEVKKEVKKEEPKKVASKNKKSEVEK